MSRILDRRSALKIGLLTTMGLGALSRYAEASTDLQPKNKVVVGRWFTEFWGKTYNPAVVDELAAPEWSCGIRCISPDVVTKRSRHSCMVFVRHFQT
jgi:hypothetical protein